MDDRDLGRVLWRSRRGMLELDLLLVDFARTRYPHLDEAQRDAYRELLGEDDWVLLDWLRGRAVPEPRFARIVAMVVAFNEPSAGEREGLAPRKEEPSAGEREGRAPRKEEPSAGEREGLAPRKEEPSAGEREGLAPRKEEPSAGEREGLAPRKEEPSAGEREGLAPRKEEPSAGSARG